MGAIHQMLLARGGSGGGAPATLRFYFPNTGAADVSPGFGSGWDGTSGADRRKCVTTRISSSMTGKTYTAIAGTSPQYILSRQFVSAPLQAGTLSGTIKGQVRGTDSSPAATLAVSVRVVSNDGSVEHGTALAPTGSASTSTPPRFSGGGSASLSTNRRMRDTSENTSIALTNVTVQAGDRLVIEIGARENVNTALNGVIVYGDNNASDLPEAEDTTTTTALNPWIEFSSCPPLQ